MHHNGILMPIRKKGKHERHADQRAKTRRIKTSKRGKPKSR